jgi:trk system potassium uptake protein TrkA
MSLFHREPKQHIIIVGCGHFGLPIVKSLLGQNYEVTVIDNDPEAFLPVPITINGRMITGDGTDPETLEVAGILSADAVIVATNDDAVNIMISQMVRQKYHVETVIARLYDFTKKQNYQDLGVQMISPVSLFTDACMQTWSTVRE